MLNVLTCASSDESLSATSMSVSATSSPSSPDEGSWSEASESRLLSQLACDSAHVEVAGEPTHVEIHEAEGDACVAGAFVFSSNSAMEIRFCGVSRIESDITGDASKSVSHDESERNMELDLAQLAAGAPAARESADCACTEVGISVLGGKRLNLAALQREHAKD